MRHSKRYIAAILTLCMTGGVLSGCNQTKSEVMSTAIHVDTQDAQVGNLELSSTYIGTVSPNDSVNVTPLVSGTVKNVNVKIGDTVKAGDVLCKFDDTGASFSVRSAKDAVNSAQAGKKSAESQQDLSSSQSSGSLDTMEDTLDGYKESLSTAKEQRKKLKASKSTVKSAMSAAQSAYTAAKTRYKTAQTLSINYKSFLSANPECQTTAGLTIMANTVTTQSVTGDSSQTGGTAKNGEAQGIETQSEGTQTVDPATVKTASSLLNSLNKGGITVEYLTESGLNSLKEDADDAENAYNTASGSYGEVESGLATLNSTISTLEAQIKATQGSIKSTKKALSASGAVSDDASAVYDAQINSAQTGVDSAQYQKDLYTIKAPIGGVVEAVNVTADEMSTTGMPAFTISGKDTMLVTFYVTEEAKNYLQIGDAIEAKNGDQTYRGNVSSIATAVDATKGLFPIEAQIYTQGEKKLSSGVSLSLSTVTSSENTKIVIPYDSVYYDNNQPYVFKVDNGKAVRVDVTTGLYNDDSIVVEDGLNTGDKVITSWASGLKNGAEIAEDDTEKTADDTNKGSDEKAADSSEE